MSSILINNYFLELENRYSCLKKKEVQGCKYIFNEEYIHGEIIRIPVNDYMEFSFFNIQDSCIFDFEYLNNKNLLIISYCLEGESIISYGNNDKILGPKDIKYYRNMNIKKCINCSKSKYKSVSLLIDLNYYKEHEENIESSCKWESYINKICKENELLVEKSSSKIEEKMCSINKMNLNNFLSYLKINQLVYDAFFEIIWNKINLKHIVCPRDCNEYICKIENITMTNLSETPSVNTIVESLNISYYKLQKIFKQYKNTTVYDYIKNLKLDYSKRYLKENKYSIIEISNIIGYQNPSKYSSAFKIQNGITPTEYRDKHIKI